MYLVFYETWDGITLSLCTNDHVASAARLVDEGYTVTKVTNRLGRVMS